MLTLEPHSRQLLLLSLVNLGLLLVCFLLHRKDLVDGSELVGFRDIVVLVEILNACKSARGTSATDRYSQTHNFAQQYYVLASDQEKATLDVSVQVLNEDSLDAVLEYEVPCCGALALRSPSEASRRACCTHQIGPSSSRLL